IEVARLLAAQDVARSAKFEVERGYSEAGAEVGEFADRGKPTAGDGRQFKLTRDQQVGIRTSVRTPDTSAQLIQLGEAVIVGTVDDDRVGTGNVDAVFDDGRRHEHVIFVIDEIEHYLLHFLFVHLAVADGDAGIGDDLLYKGGDRLDSLHAIV